MMIGHRYNGLRAVCLGFALAAIACGIDSQNSLQAQEGRVIELPAARLDRGASIERVLSERRSVREYADRPISLEDAAQLLWAAQGVTEPRRGLRTAPSAGATYPLETYLVAGEVTDLAPGLYRYVPAEHRLELVQEGDLRHRLAEASLRQRAVADAPVSIVLAAVYARTEGRYGGRTPRYVHMEVGTAAQNISLQAVSLGLGTVYIGAFRDDEVARLLALPDDEAPLAVLPAGWPR